MMHPRAIAKIAGLSRYNTGKTCARGHASDRRVSNGQCIACDREDKASDFARAPAKYLAKNAAYRGKNPSRCRSACADWRKENPARAAAHTAKRRALKLAAVPADFGEFDQLVMAEAAEAAKRRAKMHGEAFDVDHMVPLAQGGKHAWWNIQVIPSRLNRRKGAKLIYTKPQEWLEDAIKPENR